MINSKMKSEMQELSKTFYPPDYPQYSELMDQCCLSIVFDTIKRIGLFENRDDEKSILDIKSECGISDDKDYILNNLLFILVEDGVLEKRDEKYKLVKVPDIEAPAEFLVRLTKEYPKEADTFLWLARCYGGLYDVLKGRVHPEDALFPYMDFTLLENFYNSSTIYNYYPRLGAAVVTYLIKNIFKRHVSLLEVGAGTGNATWHLLNEVKDFEKYLFTDISKSLLKRSKKKFENFDFIDYKILDILDLAKEDYSDERYDIVYAVNVMHSLNNLEKGLTNIKSMLKDTGFLVISELSHPDKSVFRFMELTFGLLPSYYKFEDKENRERTPLLRQERWVSILKKYGFSDAFAIPGERHPDIDIGGVIVGVK